MALRWPSLQSHSNHFNGACSALGHDKGEGLANKVLQRVADATA
jgi:hypothetical protein